MASFDFIEAAVRGYEFVWRHKGYLARVAFPVVFVKIACVLAVVTLGLQDMYLRQGIVLLPGYVVEALFMVGLIRYALYGESIFIWGRSVPSENPPTSIIPSVGSMSRVQCVQAGVAVYLLSVVVLLAATGVIMDYAQTVDPSMVKSSETPPTFAGGFVILAILSASVWMFRLFWLYIPVAMGASLFGFVRRIRGMSSSFYMIGTWLMCFLPPMVVYAFGLQILAAIFPQGTEGFVIGRAIFQAIFDVTVVSLQVTAMTYGFTEILFGSDKKDEK